MISVTTMKHIDHLFYVSDYLVSRPAIGVYVLTPIGSNTFTYERTLGHRLLTENRVLPTYGKPRNMRITFYSILED